MFQWWGFVILTPALLGYLFCKTETRRQCIIAAVAGGFIFWRLIQDSLSEFGQVGGECAFVLAGYHIYPGCFKSPLGMEKRLSNVLADASGLGGR